MKTIFTAVLFIMTSYAQWQWQNPLPQGNDLRNIHSLSSSAAIAVGHYGSIVKTEDGGKNWEIKSHLTSSNLYGLCFPDLFNGFAVGLNGTVIRTTDQGENWSLLSSGTKESLFSIDFIDQNTGIAVGRNGIILKTTDAGNNWFPQISGVTVNLRDICFLTPNSAVIVGNSGTVLRTTNGGNNWINIEVDATYLNDLFFTDTLNGFIAGEVLLKTTDGGLSWLKQVVTTNASLKKVQFADPLNGFILLTGDSLKLLNTTDGGITWFMLNNSIITGFFYDLSFFDTDKGIIVGKDGLIHYSSDGGNTWIKSSRGENKSLKDVDFSSYTNGIAVGYEIILRTTNAGNTWDKVPLDLTRNWLHNIQFINEEVGFISGDQGYIYKTNNGGESWIKINIGTYHRLNALSFIDEYNGLCVVTNNDELTSRVFRTSDGGNSWLSVFNHSYLIYGICYVDYSTAIAIGIEEIFRTTDGGLTWNKQEYPEIVFSSISFIDSLNGLIVGDQGLILKTNDGGFTWEIRQSGTTENLRDISFNDADNVSIIGYSGVLLISKDGGCTWQMKDRIPAYTISSVSFRYDQITVVGSNGAILRSNKDQIIPVEILFIKTAQTNNILHISWKTASEINNRGFEIESKYLNSDWSTRGFVPGAVTSTEPKDYTFSEELKISGKYFYRLKQVDFDGSFEHSDIAEVIFNAVPTEFSLQQNYPNPFNPATTISYSIPEQARVRINLYDALGREVKVLINEEKAPGNYSISLDAAALATGIYYYHIKAGTFSETRKMLLLR